MPFRTSIILCGPAGSGKSTVADLLAARLSVPHIGAGAIFRRQMEEYGMDEIALGRRFAERPELDRALDDAVLAYALQGQAVLEGRALALLAKRRGIRAFAVWLSASPLVAARRVARREGIALDEALRDNDLREAQNADRLKRLYGGDYADPALYALTVDTDLRTPDDIADHILASAKAHR